MAHNTSTTARERLVAYRVLHGITQVELARRCGCDPSAIVRIEAGDRQPGLGLAVKIEAATGIEAGAWPNLSAPLARLDQLRREHAA